jgi:hypothetical protein
MTSVVCVLIYLIANADPKKFPELLVIAANLTNIYQMSSVARTLVELRTPVEGLYPNFKSRVQLEP